MGVDIKDERVLPNNDEQQAVAEQQAPRLPLAVRARTAFGQINWPVTLLIAALMALAWCSLFIFSSTLQILAGLVPVTGGLFLGRRVKQQYLLHGILLGLFGYLLGLLVVLAYVGLVSANAIPLAEQARQLILGIGDGSPSTLIGAYLGFGAIALLPFPAFGTVMAGRSEERNRAVREIQEARGGRLERPGTVRSADDLNGLSLPQFGYYVNTLFKKQGFSFKDYRFTDKDKHLDLWMEYEAQTYQLRLSVADKVRPGTVESLVQDMRKQQIAKGIVITSTEFTPDALKAGKGRKNIVLIDGATLYDMAESK